MFKSSLALAAIVVGVVGAAPASAAVKVDLYAGTGTIGLADVSGSFASTKIRGQVRAHPEDVNFRRNVDISYQITCLPEAGGSYTEANHLYLTIYANSSITGRKPTSNYTLSGWIPPQIFEGQHVGAVTHCANGDPASRPTWMFGYRGWGNYWVAPNVAPTFNYQNLKLRAEYRGHDGAVLATAG